MPKKKKIKDGKFEAADGRLARAFGIPTMSDLIRAVEEQRRASDPKAPEAQAPPPDQPVGKWETARKIARDVYPPLQIESNIYLNVVTSRYPWGEGAEKKEGEPEVSPLPAERK